MGTVIDFEAYRRARRPPAPAGQVLMPANAVRFSYDVVSPFTYLAAERVERTFPGAVWCAVDPGLSTEETWTPAVRRRAEQRAGALRQPLVWPEERELPRERRPEHGRAVRRAAAFASSRGRAPAFVTAVGRLSFCGGYDPDSIGVIIEAAEAARLPFEDCLAAAEDPAWDAVLAEGMTRVAGCGELPVLELAGQTFSGEHRLAEAAAAMAPLTG